MDYGFLQSSGSGLNTPLQKNSISLSQEILLCQLFISDTGIKSQNTIIFPGINTLENVHKLKISR